MARRRSRSRFHPFASLVATIGVAVLGLLVFLLTSFRDQPPEPVALENVAPLSTDWQRTFPERLEGVTTRLEKSGIPLPRPTIEVQGGELEYVYRRYELTLSHEEEGELRQQLESVRRDDPSVALAIKTQADGLRADIGVDGHLTHTVLVHWRFEHSGPPRVALIIDDLGDNLLVARELMALDFPVALAVLPQRPFSREVASLAEHYEHDVLLHLPMEANGDRPAGDRMALRIDADREEILNVLERSLSSVPHTIGVNNHRGSLFTQDRERMTWVLQYLKDHDLFFVDSRTTPRSVAAAVAASVGLPYLSRQVFLDDSNDRGTVEQRLDELLEAGRRLGTAIGIGHPRQKTLAALRSFGARAKKQGVEVVRLSSFVASPAHDPS